MRVLMFGWEFPPHTVGGLGNVTYHLTNALVELGLQLTLFLPVKTKSKNVRIVTANLSVNCVETVLMPYMNEGSYKLAVKNLKEEYGQLYGSGSPGKNSFVINQLFMDKGYSQMYGGNLFEEVELFAQKCKALVEKENFDVIHCHDWLTFKAGCLAKEMSGRPLILHVHTTELDRSCGGRNQRAYDIEKECFEKADKIIAVSNYTKNKIIEGYGINPDKVEVVHNAIQFNGQRIIKDKKKRKVVLYFGRLSLHKGPDYFIRAARKVLEYEPEALFVVAGGGELLPELIHLACQLGIANKVLFTGKVTDEEVHRIYEAADVYVMPSVSEPFGITALEAASHGTPIIISKNSGAKEVLKHCLEVDFWDIEEMANKIVSVLRYPQLGSEMTFNAYKELDRISWRRQAEEVIKVYNKVVPAPVIFR